jgi:hypothetical protein
MNSNIATSANEERLSMPSLENMNNNEYVYYFVDVGGVEEQNGVGSDEEPNKEVNEEES